MNILKTLVIAQALFMLSNVSYAHDEGVNLYILSGQSNMARLPLRLFKNEIHKEHGTNYTIFVKHAKGGQPISRWDESLNGDIYRDLMDKVDVAIAGKEITTVTFVWYQGETDALNGDSEYYLYSFNNLLYQLERDLGRTDIRIVVARINDWGRSNEWYNMRAILEYIGDNYPNAAWINTDDLNGAYNDLHTVSRKYKELARRLAEAAQPTP